MSVHRVAPYRVSFTPAAWKTFCIVSFDTFQSMKTALDEAALNLGTAPAGSPPPPATFELAVAGYRLFCTRNEATRTLTLVDIQRTA